jgi:hypothetical protein
MGRNLTRGRLLPGDEGDEFEKIAGEEFLCVALPTPHALPKQSPSLAGRGGREGGPPQAAEEGHVVGEHPLRQGTSCDGPLVEEEVG